MTMTRYLASPKGRFGPYDLFGAARAILALMKNVAQGIENRRAVTGLLEWDDRALKDIGLTRTDVRLALGLPLSEDPSRRLCDWASERRVARTAGDDGYDGPIERPQLRLVEGCSLESSASISRR
jgi:uncharacterized protein YjiS (DUF1127 family)